MMPAHHPIEAQLLDYAAGAASEPAGLLVATHLSLCAECRARIAELEAIGGALIEGLPAVPTRGIEAVLARLDEPEPAAGAPTVVDVDAPTRQIVPAPLRAYLGASLDALRWRRVGRGLELHDLPLNRPGFKTQLLRIRAGAPIPRHGHRGLESVLVLDGGYSDENGHYARGDVGVSDAAIVHRPIADADGDCLCLSVVEGGLRFAGLLGRILGLFAH